MELIKVAYNGEGVAYQAYEARDEKLIVSDFINSNFGAPEDSIEYSIYDTRGQLIDINYDAKEYYPNRGHINSVNDLYSSITLDPLRDVKDRGFNRGETNIQYSFYKNLFSSSYTTNYWIKDISPSRTELRLTSQILSNSDVLTGFRSYEGYVALKNYYTDFYLNFGLNRTVIAVNVAYEEDSELNSYLLIKLYEPLPTEFDVKSTLWMVEKLAETVSYDVNIEIEAELITKRNPLRGPNFNIKVKDEISQTTPYYNYEELFSSELSSSMQQLSSYYDDKSISINVDFTDFNNFVRFSSITERINNFVYKLGLIESLEAEIVTNNSLTSLGANSVLAVSQSIGIAKNKIDNIIKKFDLYEYYLYYSSGSYTWPKSNDKKPYSLYSVTSSEAYAWLGHPETLPNGNSAVSMMYSASLYDLNNSNCISTTIPQYLYEDENNAPFISFMNMIGQHFDNIWLYYKDVSNRYDNTNNPETGISIDLVADALKGLGFKLYTNTSVSDNLYYSLFGMNPDGSLLPPTGSELITNYVSSSLETQSSNQLQKEIYKRLYHNVPYLLKTKGTQRSIKALIACFGIPESILEVNEFGGYQRYQRTGVSDAFNEKVEPVYDQQYLSASLLSPYVTIQKYDTSYRLNSRDIEVGFSTSNIIDNNISESIGFINIDDFIGNPEHQYLRTYPDLRILRNNYFAGYDYPHSVWEYIRLVKYYNNSLFKIIKDFTPARSNTSTAIIVKSHVLERNKYARHEPSGSVDVNANDRLGMVRISGGPANTTSYSSSWSSTIITPCGSLQVKSTDSVEKYTGAFTGSYIKITDGYFDQREVSSNYSSSFSQVSPMVYTPTALYHNVTSSVRSVKYLDLDYTYNQIVPVNFGLITASISASRASSTNRPYSLNTYPYAQIQDTNYSSRAFTDVRYWGSKTISAKYTTYTEGDQSYGNTAAIDKIKNAFAYLVDIYSSSIYFPGRANAQIKYLIDANQNVLDLTKANDNLFDVQNIFKSGETVDIALFQYDENNPYSQNLANNPTLQIYEGGFRYLPIMHNLKGNLPYSTFNLKTPLALYVSGSGSNFNPNNPQWSPANYNIESYDFLGSVFNEEYEYTVAQYAFTASYTVDIGFPQPFSASLSIEIPRTDGVNYEILNILFTPGGSYLANAILTYVYYGGRTAPNPLVPDSAEILSIKPYPNNINETNPYTAYYVPSVTSSYSDLYYLTASNQLVIKLSDEYGTQDVFERYSPVFSSSLDPDFSSSALSPVVLPFNIATGDKISFFNSASLGWDERFEFTVREISFVGLSSTTQSRLLVQLDKNPPLNLFTSSVGSIESVTNANYRANKYIIYKHVPDETNIILRYDPKDSNIVEEGLLYPKYLKVRLRRKSGNIIKSLRSQNLITTRTTPP